MSEHQLSFGLDDSKGPEPAGTRELRDEIAEKWGLPLGERVEVEVRGQRFPVTGTLTLVSTPDFPWDPREPLQLAIGTFVFRNLDLVRWTKL